MDSRDFDERDDALEAELRSAAALFDPVPAQVLAAARAAIEFRDLDAQLAELMRDSSTEAKELSGVRGDSGRLLTFGTGERFVEVEITASGDDRSAVGYVVPASEGVVSAESAGGPVESELDAQGRFRLTGLSHGPIRLRLSVPGLPALLTPWTGI